MENEGIDPPINLPVDPYYEHPDNASLVYPPCRKCGKSHGMGMRDTYTGKIVPMDICKKCLLREE